MTRLGMRALSHQVIVRLLGAGVALVLASDIAHAAGEKDAARAEFGFAYEFVKPFGEMIGPAGGGGGVDVTLRYVPAGMRVGVRFSVSVDQHQTRAYEIEGQDFFGDPVSGTYMVRHFVRWLAVGPEVMFPVGNNRLHLYALAARVSVDPRERGRPLAFSAFANVVGPRPTSTAAFGGVLGTAMILDLGHAWRSSLDFGFEYRAAGACEFYDDPAVVPDGAGNYSARTTRARVSSLHLRLGLVTSFQ